MPAAILNEQYADSLEHLCRLWESRPEHKHAPCLTVALARTAGTPAREVAEALARRLGWQVYDRELLDKIAEEMGLRAKLLESVDEKRIGWMLEAMQGLFAVPQVDEIAYVRHLVKVVLALGMHGNCVIVGRGAAHFLPPSTTVRVHLTAPVKDRIARFAKEEGVAEDKARTQVADIERARASFVERHFFKDANDSANYDLTLNTSCWSPDACAQIILEALQQKATQANPRPLETAR